MRHGSTCVLMGLSLLLLAGGCATSPHGQSNQAVAPTATAKDLQALQQPGGAEAPPEKPQETGLDQASRQELRRALQRIPAQMKTGLIAPPASRLAQPVETLSSEKQKILFNFDKADITEVTNEIFGGYLKVGYVMDPSLQGRISLYLEGEYSKPELIQLITRAYNASNVAVTPRDGIYFIQPVQRSSSSNLPVADSLVLKADGKGVRPVIVIYRPKYLDAAQAINTVKFFLTPGRPMISDLMTNSILFAEDTDNAKTILELLRTLDMNVLQEIGMEVIQLKALAPGDAVKSVEAVLNKLAVFQHSSLKNNVAFLPLEQLGGVLVLAQNNDMLRTAKHWLIALDAQGQEAGDQIEVYFVQNGLAKNISDILGEVYDIGEKTSKKKLTQEVVAATETPKSEPGKNVQITKGQAVSASLTGDITIIADETNNAIVVRANAADQMRIKATIEALDIIPRAVLIEVLIAEVTLTDEISYGVEWYIKNKGMNLFGYQGQYAAELNNGKTYDPTTPEDGSNNLGSAADLGLSLFWGSLDGDIAALVTLLSSKTKVHILSSPTLLATDNQEASINVGGSEPIISQQSQNTSSDTTLVNTVQYVDTGIILNVTPHINAGGLVRNELDLTIRDAQPNTVSGIDSPAFTERKVKTTLLAKDGETVLIGGIIEQNGNEKKSGIPILSDIPIISPLFSTTTKTGDRTELIIAITPHVRRRQGDEVSEEFIHKLNDLKHRIQMETGLQDGDMSLIGKRKIGLPQ